MMRICCLLCALRRPTGGFDIDLNIDHQGAGILFAEVRKRELGDWQPSGGTIPSDTMMYDVLGFT